VLVESFRPDVKNRLGIDYETLKAVNPRLIYACISGFGRDGSYRHRPGVDQIAQEWAVSCRSPASPASIPCV
jgi:crotonobetainyl-CoA:carnitine CoA-transferase CaiB-like acyl-CoA transferase